MSSRFNSILRTALLGTRWGMAPFCLGLIAALLLLLAQFARELAHVAAGFADMGGSDVIVAVLKLVDLVLIANLVILIITAAAAIFLPAEPEGEAPRQGAGIEFGSLKPKLFGSICAIAAVELLESFIKAEPVDKSGVVWEILILIAFAVTGLLLAWMDRLTAEGH